MKYLLGQCLNIFNYSCDGALCHAELKCYLLNYLEMILFVAINYIGISPSNKQNFRSMIGLEMKLQI